MDIIESVANRLAYKFQFGYHSLEDMKQQARLEALQGLPNYDGVRPLENFLWTHVRNRLYNFKRNKYARPDLPCHTCPFQNKKLKSECEEYVDRMECDLYSNWFKRNQTKKNLAATVSMDYVSPDNEVHMKSYDTNLENTEIIDLIDGGISVEFREDWIRLKNNLRLPKSRKDKLLEEVFSVLEENNISKEDWIND